MIDFDDLVVRIQTLRSMCTENVGSKEIYEISVDTPTPPLDELYFRKAIAWCYVLLHETGPFIKFSAKLLRARPDAHETYGITKRLVECARTVHAHNLLRERQSDAEKSRFYEIWLIENGGDPFQWELCNQALVRQVDDVLSKILEEWRQRSEEKIDRDGLWSDYIAEKRTFWDAHEFDPFIVKAADQVGLEGFNTAAFRQEKNRVDRWRGLIGCFDTREAAEHAIDRAIKTELLSLFGGHH